MIEIDQSLDRPLPSPTPLTAPFWEACRHGQLVVQRCNDCGNRFFTPTVACPTCFSTAWVWTPSPGTGTVYTFTTVWRPATPAFKVPYVLAVIDLDDGWPMLSQIIDCPVDAVAIDMPVCARFVPVTAEVTLPYFAPRGPDGCGGGDGA